MLTGVLHLGPLPGAPRYRHDPLPRAMADARALARAGVDAILVENFGDAPFLPGPVEPHTVALMTEIARRVREEARLPIGVNVLRNDPKSALAVALAAGGSFIRVNVHVGVAFTDQGRIEGRAHETLRYRRAIGAEHVKIFADVLVKHSRPARAVPLAVAARDCAYRGLADALLVTGDETGSAPDPARVAEVKRAVPDRPVLVASGITPANIRDFDADGFIVGTYFKRRGRVDAARVRRLMARRAARSSRPHDIATAR